MHPQRPHSPLREASLPLSNPLPRESEEHAMLSCDVRETVSAAGEHVSAPDTCPPEPAADARTSVERLLGLFAPIEPGEGVTALLLTLNVFLLLAAYYLLKVAREPLILAAGGAELKAYSAAGQAALLLCVVRAYDAAARRFGRLQLILTTTLFFASNLVVFWAAARAGASIGVPFYLWVGVFNVTMIAQFWGFATDVYAPDQGKRLFAIVGVGSSVGALVGARVAQALLELFGVRDLLLVSAAVVLACLGLTYAVHRREGTGRAAAHSRARHADAPIGGPSGLSLVLGDRYLVLVALLVLVLSGVNTTGEYLLDRTLLTSLGGHASDKAIGHFKAEYFFWVNGLALALQLFVVSRVLRHAGVRGALVVLPAVALGGYSLLSALPLLSVALPVKVVENSIDYSLENTARQVLFLPVSRVAKYKAKAVIDGLLVRVGDLLSAGLVWLGVRSHLSTHGFATMNVALAALWLVVVAAIAREHARRTSQQIVSVGRAS